MTLVYLCRDALRWWRHHRTHGPTFVAACLVVSAALFLAGLITGLVA